MSFGYRFPPLPQVLDDRPSPPVPTTYLKVWIRLKERDYCLHRFQGNLFIIYILRNTHQKAMS